MLKAIPRTLSLRPFTRQLSTPAPTEQASTTHDKQAFAKPKEVKDVAGRSQANTLLLEAVAKTAAAAASRAGEGAPASGGGGGGFANRHATTRPSGGELPKGAGRWATTATDGTGRTDLPGARAAAPPRRVAGGLLAGKLLQRRKAVGGVYDADARAIVDSAPEPRRSPLPPRDYRPSTPSDRSPSSGPNRRPPQSAESITSPRPPRAPRAPRPNSTDSPTASATSTSPYPRPPRSGPPGGGAKRPAAGGKGGRTSSRFSPSASPAADLPPLKFPTKVFYPTLDVAALVKADLESRALRLKDATADALKEAAAEEEGAGGREARLAKRREKLGDYSRWGQTVGTGVGPEALRQASSVLRANPSVGLLQREVLLKEVEKALRGVGGRH